MRLKFIKDEDFVNYKKASMFLGTISCSFKCCKEQGLPCSTCQNEPWYHQPVIEKKDDDIVQRYLDNFFTSAVVLGGMEPLDQFEEVFALVGKFREKTNDDICIYTGYREDEVQDKVERLSQFPNVIVKFGRYIPNAPSRYDDVLGVTLASDNQYAKKIS